jgi:hypothetical protein
VVGKVESSDPHAVMHPNAIKNPNAKATCDLIVIDSCEYPLRAS